MPTVQVQGREESCVDGAQGILGNESILTQSASYCDVFVRTKEAQHMPHLPETNQRSKRHRRSTAGADVYNHFPGLYLPCSTHSALTMGVRGEGKPRLSWLLGSPPLYPLSPCAITLKPKHRTQPSHYHYGQMLLLTQSLQRCKSHFQFLYSPSSAV